MKKFLKYCESIGPFFAAEGIQIIVVTFFTLMYGFIASIFIGIHMGLNGESGTENFSEALAKYASLPDALNYVLSVVAVLICGIVFYFWYRKFKLGSKKIEMKKVITRKNLLLFFLLGLGGQCFMSGLMSIAQPFFVSVFTNYSKTIGTLLSGNIIVVIIFTVFIAPITEELIFRGMILQKANKEIPFIGANILQAALFGIYHWNIIQGIYVFFLALLLGYIYKKFQTLLAPILLHMFFNASAFIIMFFPNNTIIAILTSVVGGLLVVFPILIINKKMIRPLNTMEAANIEMKENDIEI